MNEKFFFVTEAEEGIRLDKFLAMQNKDMSRSYIKNLILDGNIFINGTKGKASYKVKEDDEIKILIPEAKDSDIKAVEMDLDLIYEDNDIIVINKKPDLVVHPVPGNWDNTLVNGLLAYTEDLSGINGIKRPGIVHRLDKDTSGAIVVAKNDESHRQLVQQFKDRETKKIYHCIVKGRLSHEKGIINAPIGRNPKERKKMAVTKENSKKAVSEFKVLDVFPSHTYLQVKLLTGRTHQIRVHLSYMGHPILGDDKYGKRKKKDFHVKRQMLHAHILGFNHPIKGEWKEFKAELPEDFKTTLDKINKKKLY
ncbi:RluA family pseudouridine synthase [Natronospora cellulosivora (SeqCode)]